MLSCWRRWLFELSPPQLRASRCTAPASMLQRCSQSRSSWPWSGSPLLMCGAARGLDGSAGRDPARLTSNAPAKNARFCARTGLPPGPTSPPLTSANYGAYFLRPVSGTIVSPRASIATSEAIFRARPAAVFMLLVRKANAKRFSRPSVWNVLRARGFASIAARRSSGIVASVALRIGA
jgi:hypothetical protein